MTQLFADNCRALLTASIGAADTSLTVEAAKADRFPVGTTTSWGTVLNWFKVVLIDNSGNREVIKVGVRTLGSGVFSNILRAQDGTTALTFAAGSVAICPITAADIQAALSGSFAALVSTGTLDVAGKMKQGAVEGRFTPVGGIIMWSGAVAAIPTGWALCDGTNGTPNLRDRFVIGAGSGAGSNYAVGATGGSKDAVVVSHTHTASTGNESAQHTHAVNDPGHTHNYDRLADGSNAAAGPFGGVVSATSKPSVVTTGSFTGVSVGTNSVSHTHAVTVDSAGVSAVDANLPPYYALAFIQCLAT